MVTDLDGRITQNVVYIPYGEVFVEERNGSWASPYLFNAKELDEETGLYYYGARYLNPSIALWLSTDPLQGKYPGMSPYNYCAGNPVKLVDPDGTSLISMGAKRVLKTSLKHAAVTSMKKNLQHRLSKYLSSKSGQWTSKFIDKATTAIDIATSESYVDLAVEFVPVLGDAYGAFKLAESSYKVWNLVEKFERRAEAIDKALKGKNNLRKALGKISGEAHHIIPVKLLKENEVVQDAVSAGFDFNGAVNGVEAVIHHGSHFDYTDKINDLLHEYQKRNPNYTPEQAKDFFRKNNRSF